MARPKGSTSALAARASARNLQAKQAREDAPAAQVNKWTALADRREEAKLSREEAQAIREQARAREESGELCRRAEAIAEVTRIQRLVRTELDRVLAYLDPGLPPEVRAPCEAALKTTTKKLRNAIASKVDPHGR